MTLVEKADLIISRFGSWPDFHDAEVTKVELQSDRKIMLMQLRAFQTLKEVDAQGYYKISNVCLITFRFSGIGDLTLADFNEQNSIFSLLFDKVKTGIKVTIEPSYGLRGVFLCDHAEVVSVQMLDDNKSKQQTPSK